jgi:hypothetical protein
MFSIPDFGSFHRYANTAKPKNIRKLDLPYIETIVLCEKLYAMHHTTILPGRYTLLTDYNTKIQASVLSCLFPSNQTPLFYAIINGIRCTIEPTKQNWIIDPIKPSLKRQIVSLPQSSPDTSVAPIEIRPAQLFPTIGLPGLPNGIIRIECDKLTFYGLNYIYNDENDLAFRFRDDRRIILNKNNEFIEGDRVHSVRTLYWLPIA